MWHHTTHKSADHLDLVPPLAPPGRSAVRASGNMLHDESDSTLDSLQVFVSGTDACSELWVEPCANEQVVGIDLFDARFNPMSFGRCDWSENDRDVVV